MGSLGLVGGESPRAASRTRAELRRSEALEHAVKLAVSGLATRGGVIEMAKEFEKFLRNNDGPPRPTST